MKNFIAFLSFVLLLLSNLSCIIEHPTAINIDSVFVHWNRATIESYKVHIKATDDSQDNPYMARLTAFREYIGIHNDGDINRGSIRYQFLQEILKDQNRKDFYIIEANRSGEQVEIRNYVVHFTGPSFADVSVYNFLKNRWVKEDKSKKINIKPKEKVSQFATKFGTGFNPDDVTISRFINNASDESEFFLYTTLSSVDGYKEIFALR